MLCTRKRHSQSASSGFTLVEIVVAVLIIGILAASAAPRISNRISYHRADSAAERIASDFNLARRQAMARGVDETVAFDTGNHRYTLSSVTSLSSPTAVYTVKLDEYPYECAVLVVSFGGGSTVAFNPYGIPDNGGKIVIQSGSEQRTISLDEGSGKAIIQ